MTPAMDVKGLEALARAYDREEAACMGEPSPWDSGEDDAEWVAERISCATAGLSAYLAATLPPDVAGLVAELRAKVGSEFDDEAHLSSAEVERIATALTALSAREAKMREALEPFARASKEYSEHDDDDEDIDFKGDLRLADLRRARLASDQTGAE